MSGISMGTTGASMAPLRATMAKAAEHGAPTDASSSAAVLATGDDFIKQATDTVKELGQSIEGHKSRIGDLEKSGGSGTAIQHEREQVHLLEALQERLRQSIQRISDIMSHRDRGDDDATVGAAGASGSAPSATAPQPYDPRDDQRVGAVPPSQDAVMRAYVSGSNS